MVFMRVMVVSCIVLFCSVLFCSVLFCSVLFCSVLFCSVLFCSVLLCSVVFCCVLFCSVLFCSALCCWRTKPSALAPALCHLGCMNFGKYMLPCMLHYHEFGEAYQSHACSQGATGGDVCMQALGETSIQLLHQLNAAVDTPLQLESGLQLLLQLQSHQMSGSGADGRTVDCCIKSFIDAQVRSYAHLHNQKSYNISKSLRRALCLMCCIEVFC